MVRRRRNVVEFPLLQNLGLRATPIKADGNCLFSCLSDQLYGHPRRNAEIRAVVISYIRTHRASFASFINVDGSRRNRKRKTTLASSSFSFTEATDKQKDRAFEEYLKTMAQGGTYGDNVEIIAFTRAYDMDVRVFQTDLSFYIRNVDDKGARSRPIVYIAYHKDYEHYSSIRNVDGPSTGLPQVRIREPSPDSGSETKESTVQEYMGVVVTSLPNLRNRALMGKTLGAHDCSIDDTVSKLMETEYRGNLSGSLPSSPGSSSIERESDSDDDDMIWGPNKRQNRRIKEDRKDAREKKKQVVSATVPVIDLTEPETAVQQPVRELTPSSLPSVPSLDIINLTEPYTATGIEGRKSPPMPPVVTLHI